MCGCAATSARSTPTVAERRGVRVRRSLVTFVVVVFSTVASLWVAAGRL